MKKGPRALIAFVAASIATGRRHSSIYDYGAGGYRQVSGTVTPNHVNIYDYNDSCYLSGSGGVGALSLYHYGEGAHLTLNMQGNRFHGYDYGASCHFSGQVSGNSVSLYDYGEGGYFNYTAS